MRIGVFHNLPSGGAKRTLTEATRRLAARHDVDVYTLSGAEHDFADLRPWVAGHRVYEFEPLPLMRSPFGRVNPVLRYADLKRLDRLSARIGAQIDRARYDVVCVQPCRFEQSPSVLRYVRETPTVYYCHEPLRLLYEPMPPRPYDDQTVRRRRQLNRVDPLPTLYRRALGRTDAANLRSAGRVLVNSRFVAQAMARIYGIEAHVSYHGVDTEQFKPCGVKKRHMVLSVGSLTPLKGFDFLVRTMAEYPSRSRPALLIASNFQNAPERAYLEQLARDHQVALELVGAVTDQQLVELYNQALAVVYAPLREPFGLVPLEAMACGTPVVAVAEGGVTETVVDGTTGRLVDRDPKMFAAALHDVVAQPELARHLGEGGRQWVLARWTWDRALAVLGEQLEAQAGTGRALRGTIPALVRRRLPPAPS